MNKNIPIGCFSRSPFHKIEYFWHDSEETLNRISLFNIKSLLIKLRVSRKLSDFSKTFKVAKKSTIYLSEGSSSDLIVMPPKINVSPLFRFFFVERRS